MDLSTSRVYLGYPKSKSGSQLPETDLIAPPGVIQGEPCDEQHPAGLAIRGPDGGY
jgi:hypothetical protein